MDLYSSQLLRSTWLTSNCSDWPTVRLKAEILLCRTSVQSILTICQQTWRTFWQSASTRTPNGDHLLEIFCVTDGCSTIKQHLEVLGIAHKVWGLEDRNQLQRHTPKSLLLWIASYRQVCLSLMSHLYFQAPTTVISKGQPLCEGSAFLAWKILFRVDKKETSLSQLVSWPCFLSAECLVNFTHVSSYCRCHMLHHLLTTGKQRS